MGQAGWTRGPPVVGASASQVKRVTAERAMTVARPEQGSKPGFWTEQLCDARLGNLSEPESPPE